MIWAKCSYRYLIMKSATVSEKGFGCVYAGAHCDVQAYDADTGSMQWVAGLKKVMPGPELIEA